MAVNGPSPRAQPVDKDCLLLYNIQGNRAITIIFHPKLTYYLRLSG